MTTYDVGRLQRPEIVRAFVIGRWVGAGGCLLCACVCVALLVRHFVSAGPAVDLLAGGAMGTLSAAFGGLAMTRPPPATRLEIDDVGLRFGSEKHNSKSMRWTDRRFRLVLASTEGSKDWLSRGMPVYGIVVGPKVHTLLSKEMYDRLQSEANSRGLKCHIDPGYAPDWVRLTICHT